MVARSVAPALAAGCTAVVKPAEQSPLTALAFAELCTKVGFPNGVVNVVAGFGEDAGAALVAHPLVRGITFTGSVETGRKIYANAAQGLKPAVLELGGKNPMIVFDDADLDRAAFDALDGAFGNSGQVCSSSSRFLLHRSIRDEFLEKLAADAAKLTVGRGLDNCDLGPLVSGEQHDKVSSYLDAGRRSGAKLRLGGGRPRGLDRGYFVEPTIFDGVDPAGPLAREEIFGPVAVAMEFETDDEALTMANGLGYGLVSGVYSRDLSRIDVRARPRGRLRLDQRLVHRRRAGADRRHQGQRHRTRARTARHPQLPRDQEHRNSALRRREQHRIRQGDPDMTEIKGVEHHTIFKHDAHCVNQIASRLLRNGDILAVFNEERFPFHHDSGQTLITRSKDGGKTWSAPKVVLPWSETQGNWDCGICEMKDGTLIVNMTITGFFKRGVKPEQPSWSSHPMTREWGDWTWAYKTQAWLGTFVVKSSDGGETWTQPIPVNVRPLKHGGCRLGCWELPNGSLLMGLYGRIHGYEEEGEGESTRSALIRSDDGGDNWEYCSTLAYDPANIIDYEEPGM
jgi:hypothetical protein